MGNSLEILALLTNVILWCLLIKMELDNRKIMKVLQDLSIDIELYDRLRAQSRSVEKINKVGTWKK